MGFRFRTRGWRGKEIDVGGWEGGVYQMLVAKWNVEDCAVAWDLKPPKLFSHL